MKTKLAMLGLLLFIGCQKTSATPVNSTTVTANAVPGAHPPEPVISGLPATFTLKQRSQMDIPGSSSLSLLIDDITRGTVLTSLRTGKEVILQPTYLREHDRKSFEFQQRKYDLLLKKLDNALIGEDFATFELREASGPGDRHPEPLTEHEKVERLIARIESLEGARFLRNGEEHPPAEAAKHLREKRDAARGSWKTAYEFIEQVASRSSLSGEDYEIQFSDGRTMKSGEFLRQELQSIAAPPGAESSAAASAQSH